MTILWRIREGNSSREIGSLAARCFSVYRSRQLVGFDPASPCPNLANVHFPVSYSFNRLPSSGQTVSSSCCCSMPRTFEEKTYRAQSVDRRLRQKAQCHEQGFPSWITFSTNLEFVRDLGSTAGWFTLRTVQRHPEPAPLAPPCDRTRLTAAAVNIIVRSDFSLLSHQGLRQFSHFSSLMRVDSRRSNH
jgi:hypothetical protein